MPVFGKEKLKFAAETVRELASEVPPWMCCVAWAPPTASKDPAAWREPEVEIAASELAPGDEKNEEPALITDVEVRNPTVTSAEISVGVNVVPDIVVDVGFAFIADIYLAE